VKTLEKSPPSEKAKRVAQPQDDKSTPIDHVDLEMTTGAIAAKRKATSSPDLLEAAAAYLTLVEKKQKFSRAELLSAMQSATHYYKKNYSSNLTSTLKRALAASGFLSEPATGLFALTSAARARLEKELADG
jgi:hypothetical protein